MSDGLGCKCFARSSTECVCDDVDWTPSEVITLREQLAEAKKDAERYRWLRYNNNGGMVEVSISDTESGMAWLYKEHDLDAAIDQAMREGE